MIAAFAKKFTCPVIFILQPVIQLLTTTFDAILSDQETAFQESPCAQQPAIIYRTLKYHHS